MKATQKKPGVFVFTMTEDEFHEFDECGVGLCTACGEQSDDFAEPDAENYRCASCGQMKVCGTASLLVAGAISFDFDESEAT
jgi:hypothetical protein